MIDLSIIVPLYNEEENIRLLYRSIIDAVNPLGLDYEIIFVDDGSRDLTFPEARRLARNDGRLQVIKFRKNYGQTPAMAAGIDHAKGKVLVTMDGDMQNDPLDIPRLLEKLNEGYDIVVGWRHERQDKLISRKIPSRVANWLIGKVTGVPIRDNGCSLKAYRAKVIRHIPLYSEMHRFIPAMTSLAGAKLAEIKVLHHPRRFGKSKYGLSRIYRVLLDLLTIKTIIAFAARPLLWFSVLALPAAVVSVAALTSSIYELLAGAPVFPVPIAGTGVLFGALTSILILSGMLAELAYKTGDTRLERLAFLTLEKIRGPTDGD